MANWVCRSCRQFLAGQTETLIMSSHLKIKRRFRGDYAILQMCFFFRCWIARHCLFWICSAACPTARAAYDGNDTYVAPSLLSVNVVSKASVAGAPAVSAQNANSLDLFVKETDSALWWTHFDGQAWSTSTSLGGYLTSDPSAVSRDAGKIDVFARGSDGALWSKNTTNNGTSWPDWYKLAGGSSPAPALPRTRRMQTASTSLYRAPTTPSGIRTGMARRGRRGHPSAGN